jgi:hypothetical protein
MTHKFRGWNSEVDNLIQTLTEHENIEEGTKNTWLSCNRFSWKRSPLTGGNYVTFENMTHVNTTYLTLNNAINCHLNAGRRTVRHSAHKLKVCYSAVIFFARSTLSFQVLIWGQVAAVTENSLPLWSNVEVWMIRSALQPRPLPISYS